MPASPQEDSRPVPPQQRQARMNVEGSRNSGRAGSRTRQAWQAQRIACPKQHHRRYSGRRYRTGMALRWCVDLHTTVNRMLCNECSSAHHLCGRQEQDTSLQKHTHRRPGVPQTVPKHMKCLPTVKVCQWYTGPPADEQQLVAADR